jgi:transposase
VPLLHRTYPGNGSDQTVLTSCLEALGELHASLDDTDAPGRTGTRTLVRDGGSWSEQLELDLEEAGYHTVISLPLAHRASQEALEYAAQRGAMKPLTGKLADVRAARLRTRVGTLDRTLVVVESQELLRGQKRGIAVALRHAKEELRKLAQRAERGRIARAILADRAQKALSREYLSAFVTATITERGGRLGLTWAVDAARRRELERTRLGRRVLCTDHHTWSLGRIVYAFRGQWNVEELFRRAKKGGVVPWGPSHQWADASLRLHTFATVIGLGLVSLARLALGTHSSPRRMMRALADVHATVVRVQTTGRGRRPAVMLASDLSAEQRRAAKTFDLERWLPGILSSMRVHSTDAMNQRPD